MTVEIEIEEEDLEFIETLLEEAISSDSIERQDRALEIRERLPESGGGFL